MARYTGEFVVKDIANNRQYLADLLWKWDVGDALTGWTLGGTPPTIAANGKIDFFGNAGAGGAVTAQIVVPNTRGELLCIIHFKLTKMLDDTSLSFNATYCGLTDTIPNGGLIWNYRVGASMWGIWCNYASVGFFVNMLRVLTPGQEYSLDIIKTQSEVIWLIDGVVTARTPSGVKGGAALSQTPQVWWCSTLKYVNFYMAYNAGQVEHYQVRDIKVGRLVGESR